MQGNTKDIKETDEQDKIINEYHSKNNHRGIDETLSHLKRQFYFPFMKNRIIKTINNCETCQTLKYDRHPPKITYEKPEIPKKPLDIIHIDIYSVNHKQILTIVDKFSKFASAYSLESRHSLMIVKSLKHFISLHGIPSKLICDQGTEFNSNIFKDFCKQYGIKVHFTSFQQTSSNSPVERLHSTLTEIYRIILEKSKQCNLNLDHDDILTEVIITYNNSIHSTTKLTPYELFYGRTYKFNKDITSNNVHEYLEKLKRFKNELYPAVQRKMEELACRNIERLNIDRNEPEQFNEEETVFRKECRRNKLTPRFTKHKIHRNHRVTIITKDNKKIHKSRIKRKKRLLQANDDPRTNNGDTRPDEQTRNTTASPRESEDN